MTSLPSTMSNVFWTNLWSGLSLHRIVHDVPEMFHTHCRQTKTKFSKPSHPVKEPKKIMHKNAGNYSLTSGSWSLSLLKDKLSWYRKPLNRYLNLMNHFLFKLETIKLRERMLLQVIEDPHVLCKFNDLLLTLTRYLLTKFHLL